MDWKYCSKCGTKNDINDSHCKHCGYDFNEEDENNYLEADDEEDKNGKFRRTYFSILSIIAPILCIALAIDRNNMKYVIIAIGIIIIVSIILVIKNKNKS